MKWSSQAFVLLCSLLAAPLQASELKVLSLPGIKAAMDRLVPMFEAETGHRVKMKFEIFALRRDTISSGSFDVAIFAQGSMQDLAKQGSVVPSSLRDIAATSIGVAVRRGAFKPDMKTVDDFKKALLGAKSVTYTKESATGAHITAVLSKLGMDDALKGKLILQPGGDMTTPAVAAGTSDLGIVLVSDILRNEGAELVAPLPAEIQKFVVQTATVGASSPEEAGSLAFVSFLSRPSSIDLFASTGLAPPPSR